MRPRHMKLAERIRELMPGTETPLSVDAAKGLADFEHDPINGYKALDEKQRRIANRAFWSRLVAEAIEIDAAKPNAPLDAMGS